MDEESAGDKTSKRNRVIVVAAVAVLLFLCVVVGVTYLMVGPVPWCMWPTSGPSGPGWSARVVASGGLERCYFVYIPTGYDPAEPMPLVLSFHGFLSNPVSQALISGWRELADREGFVLVYPQGKDFPKRWDAGPTWGISGVDDMQFFHDMVDDLSRVAPVDLSRVYVDGFSNGGGMAVRIGCEAAGEVAAIGSVAGAVVEIEGCSPARSVPAMAFHGTADPVVPYEGAYMEGWLLRWAANRTRAPTYFVGAGDWVSRWAEGNGCDPSPQVIPPQGDVRGVRYSDCDEDAGVTLYTIEDGGHTWPGGFPIPGVGKTSRDIDATEELWQFFQAYRLEDEP